MIMRRLFFLLLLVPLAAMSQTRLQGLSLKVEASATAASGDYAPLWLSSNRYGLGSVRTASGYGRVAALRPIENDSARTWRLGYGLDLVVAANHEHTFSIHQAYAEVAWKVLRLTLGAKERPLEMMNDKLSSGAMTFGINAAPIPALRLDIDWFTFPGTKGWWKWRLYGSFGIMTDGHWQEDWVLPNTRYARNTRYHEKAAHWQFGRPEIFPLTYEIGINMAAQFGGTSYNVSNLRANNGQLTTYQHSNNLKAYFQTLICQGSDDTDGSNPNASGNHLGSWVMQLRYHGKKWQARAYWERFFEDHSQLTVQYGIRDMLIGGEVNLPRNPYLSTAVFEFLTTTNQSGAVYHDGTQHLPESFAGRDNYYNHLNYAGWQNYGFAIGNPLLTSPLYNAALGHDHSLRFYNNRIKAWHVGLAGQPNDEWSWRAMATFTRNLGIYDLPFDEIAHQIYTMAEVTYKPKWAAGWQGVLAVGLDHGDLIGNSFGGQLTIAKTIDFKFSNKQ